MSVQPEQIAAWRLHNLRLAGAKEADPVAVVRWLGAVQSQDYGPAKWSVAARTEGCTNDTLDHAFNAGQILRTHVLRPTWHFVLPEDIRLLLQVTGRRLQRGSRPRWRELGLDDAVLDRSFGVFLTALRGGQYRTRRELGVILEEAGIGVDGQRLAHIVMNAELEGLICSGPLDGKQHTYAVLDERAPAAASPSDEEATRELVRRYFTSHGPATVKDFQAWCGLTLTATKDALASLPDVASFDTDGKQFWFVGEPPSPLQAKDAYLLQLYDEYLMGYRDTRGVIDVSGKGRVPTIRPGYNGMAFVSTQLIGEWKPLRSKGGLSVRIRAHRALSKRNLSALDTAASRYAAFLGEDVTVHVEDA